MGKTKLTARLMHLQPDRAKLLKQLAESKLIPQSVLLREAVDDLLIKHKVLKKTKTII